MTELVAIAFEGPEDADRVLADLRRLEKQYLIDLWDAAVAIRMPDGNVQVKQGIDFSEEAGVSGALSGALWGALVGSLFLNPFAGFGIGTLLGAGGGALVSGGSSALTGSLVDYGIDKFVRSMAETIKPGNSALFILVRKAEPKEVLAELSRYSGRILHSSLSPEQEARLKDALA